MSVLYLVSTPIGNLNDMSFRAIETLRLSDFIYAEDTRHTKLLLTHFSITTPLISYEEHSELKKIPAIIAQLSEGKTISLVSDAGTPLISDPGYKLVREAISQNITVESIPGPSSVTAALLVSGLPTDKFCFLGFLPRKKGQKQNLFKLLLAQSSSQSMTYVFFESPFRIMKTLEDLHSIYGDIEVVICRELTKIHEEILRGPVLSLEEKLLKRTIKGEITVVFHL